MLQAMRDLGKSWIFKTLLALLIISFAIWGIGDIFHGNPQQRTVAKIGSDSITVQSLQNEFQRTVKQARQNFGPEFTIQQAHQMGLLERTLTLMIEKSMFDQDLRSRGIQVSEKTILDEVAAYPQFRDKNGNFNRQYFQMLMHQNGLSEKQFLDEQRSEEGRRLLFDAVAANSNAPQTVIDNLYRARGQKRFVEILSIANNSVEDLPKADDAALKEYHEKNGDRFKAPELRAVTIIQLSAADTIKDITVSEEDLNQAYEAKKAEFSQPEQRDIAQVVLQDEAKAKEIAEAAQKTNDLTKAAKDKGFNAVSINRADQKNSALAELYTAIFALKEKEVSAPVKSAMGWHVVQVKKIYAGSEPSFADVKEKLKSIVKNELAVELLTKTVNQLDDALAAGRSLEDLADIMKLRLIKIPALSAEGKTAEGKDPVELPAKEEVLKIAYAQAAGETSSVMEDKSTSGTDFVVVRTDDITPSQVTPFEKAKDQVLAAWKKDAQAVKAKEEAEAIAKEIREGKPASNFASRHGIEIKMSQPISLLSEKDKTIPQNAMLSVFRMKKGDVVTAASADTQFVLRLADIRGVDAANPDDSRKKIVSQMAEELKMDMVDQYGKFLHKNYSLKINEDVVEFLRKQEN